MKSKFGILTTKDGNSHIVFMNESAISEGGLITSIDSIGNCATRLERSYDGVSLGERQGGMFFRYDFDTYSGRYKRIVYSSTPAFDTGYRIVLCEKKYPKCPNEWQFKKMDI